MPNTTPAPDPTIVIDLLEAFRRSKVMFAGVSLGVFDALDHGALTLGDLAQKLNSNRDGLERLLDACVGLQLLRRAATAMKILRRPRLISQPPARAA